MDPARIVNIVSEQVLWCLNSEKLLEFIIQYLRADSCLSELPRCLCSNKLGHVWVLQYHPTNYKIMTHTPIYHFILPRFTWICFKYPFLLSLINNTNSTFFLVNKTNTKTRSKAENSKIDHNLSQILCN